MEHFQMARPNTRSLTKAELRIMRALWQADRATVADVVVAVGDPPLAYTTVLTMLRILEQKGFVAHDVDGRAHVYFARVKENDAARAALSEVVSSFFKNKKTALALALMSEERPSEEIEHLKTLIARYERGAK
jgi:predicted transcriptional regulator